MNVGHQVRALREQHGFSQALLAARTGVHQAHIANIENGVKTPSLKLLMLLAAELNVSIDELVTSDDTPVPTPA